MLAAQRKQLGVATERIQPALQVNPLETVFLASLRNACLQQGQLGQAIACYGEAVQRRPARQDIREQLTAVYERLVDLGSEHQQAGRLDQAEAGDRQREGE